MRKPKPWFDAKYGWIQRRIPKQCVTDCNHSGDCCDDCERWVTRLPGFERSITDCRELAERYLREFGAWERSELANMSDFDIAVKVLWTACGDLSEQGEWLGLVH